MSCASCGSNSQGGKPAGCGSSGSSCSGGCNRMNTFDWLSLNHIEDAVYFDLVEVSFKNGARKEFFHNPRFTQARAGDIVVVESNSGYDIGRINLAGELVRLQMKKKRVRENALFQKVLRIANERDLEKMQEAREMERPVMIRAKAISRTLGLDMKIGDVEFQADKRKATFFYTADGRVDFRELIRHYAKEFKVKIEMRQIGARQESARIGGIGSCGRELCCSTWLTDFKSVTTAAARYQNLAINQSKLSGQCGRLKCCLNYELDTYMDALSKFPRNVDRLRTQEGTLNLIKTDIFKQLMFYALSGENNRGRIITLHISKVKEIKEMSEKGDSLAMIADMQFNEPVPEQTEGENMDYESVSDVIEELPEEKRRGRNRKRKGRKKRPVKEGGETSRNKPAPTSETPGKAPEPKQERGTGTRDPKGNARRKTRNKGRNRPRPNQGNRPNNNEEKKS